ncbi:hypothetical protein TNCV_4554011 [Trichonephila clavipes]|nr:hypothetical protein TNCV_4554011 [Trichonephila clavipes]
MYLPYIAHFVYKFLEEETIIQKEWLELSTSLNLIEHAWETLGKHVAGLQSIPQIIHGLTNVLRDLNGARFRFKKQEGHFIPSHHGPDLPIPSSPDTLDSILDDLDQISHISSDIDDGYDPGTNDPELFSQSDLNDLVRDLGLPNDTAEVLGSRPVFLKLWGA